MHRFHLPPSDCQGDELTLTGGEAHHAADVLRVRVGEDVSVLDGAGREFLCAVRSVSRKAVSLAVKQTEASPAPAARVTLVQAVPKGKLLESIIQKATELGVFRVIPLLSERVVMRLEGDEDVNHKAGKWQHTAIEAIKQCGQRWLPQVEPPVTLPALLARKESFDLSLAGSLLGDGRHPREYFRDAKPATIRLWIGPEGDFTEAELAAIRAAGARPITLGPLILRSDTAAIYTMSIVSYEIQSWASNSR